MESEKTSPDLLSIIQEETSRDLTNLYEAANAAAIHHIHQHYRAGARKALDQADASESALQRIPEIIERTRKELAALGVRPVLLEEVIGRYAQKTDEEAKPLTAPPVFHPGLPHKEPASAEEPTEPVTAEQAEVTEPKTAETTIEPAPAETEEVPEAVEEVSVVSPADQLTIDLSKQQRLIYEYLRQHPSNTNELAEYLNSQGYKLSKDSVFTLTSALRRKLAENGTGIRLVGRGQGKGKASYSLERTADVVEHPQKFQPQEDTSKQVDNFITEEIITPPQPTQEDGGKK